MGRSEELCKRLDRVAHAKTILTSPLWDERRKYDKNWKLGFNTQGPVGTMKSNSDYFEAVQKISHIKREFGQDPAHKFDNVQNSRSKIPNRGRSNQEPAAFHGQRQNQHLLRQLGVNHLLGGIAQTGKSNELQGFHLPRAFHTRKQFFPLWPSKRASIGSTCNSGEDFATTLNHRKWMTEYGHVGFTAVHAEEREASAARSRIYHSNSGDFMVVTT